MISLLIALNGTAFADDDDRREAVEAAHEERRRLEHEERKRRHHEMENAKRDEEMKRLKIEEEALRAQMRVLMLDYEQADGSLEKQRVRGDIEDLAGEIFDHRTAMHERKVAKVEERLDEAKSELAEREENRDQLIDEWLEEHLVEE